MGSALHRIEFLEALGKGGFGAVYLANVTRSDALVQRLAVKLMRSEDPDRTDLLARHRDEARLLAQLNHDHIVKVMDLTEIHGRPALIMEYVEGVDANALLNEGPVPARACVQIIRCTASALAAAWSTPNVKEGTPLRVIHRDIKPSNLLISRHGGVKVLDFGIARAEFDREGKTTAGQLGTARFMAPEQWLSSMVGPAVDIYALGVTFLELLIGKRVSRLPLEPHRFRERLDRQLDSVPLDDQSPSARRQVLSLLREMLAFDDDQRPTAEEVEDRCADLVELLQGRSLVRLAQDRVPRLITIRRQTHQRDPLLAPYESTREFSTESTDSFPKIETEVLHEPGSEDTIGIPESPIRTHRPGRWLVLGMFGFLSSGIVMGLVTWDRIRTDSPTTVEVTEAPPQSPAPDKDERPPFEGTSRIIEPESPEPNIEASSPPEPASPPAVSVPPSETDIRIGTVPDAPRDISPSPTIDPELVTIVSIPWGAVVRLDDRDLGTTPLTDIPLTPGIYELEFSLNAQSSIHTVEVIEERRNHFSWTQENDELRTLQRVSP